jgi:hypothetical protein
MGGETFLVIAGNQTPGVQPAAHRYAGSRGNLCGLFNIFGCWTTRRQMDVRMNDNLERNRSWPNPGNITAFPYKDWGKPEKTSARMVKWGLNWSFLNRNQEINCYSSPFGVKGNETVPPAWSWSGVGWVEIKLCSWMTSAFRGCFTLRPLLRLRKITHYTLVTRIDVVVKWRNPACSQTQCKLNAVSKLWQTYTALGLGLLF